MPQPVPSTPGTLRGGPSPQDVADADRNRRLGIIVGAVLLVSALVAGVVIFSGGGGTSPTTPASSLQLRADGTGLVMGSDGAPHTVVVYDDFLCAPCRDVETGSRDFLAAYAKAGTVRVEYRPFSASRSAGSQLVLSAWESVLAHATPAQALAFHDRLFDELADASTVPSSAQLTTWARDAKVSDTTALSGIGSTDAGVVAQAAAAAQGHASRVPTVLLDGRPVTGSSTGDLLDHLESALAAG